MHDPELGDLLEQLRTDHGMTLEAVAGYLGVRPQKVARWEAGKKKVPAKVIQELAGLYGISIGDIYGPKEVDPEDA